MAQGSPKVNKEAIKTLVVMYGQREAARRSGLSENTVKSWALRYGWQQANGSTAKVHPISTQSPADALSSVIQANGHATKLGLSTYARRQAEELASKGKLKDHTAFRNVTSGASQLHGWEAKSEQPAVLVNVAILGIDPASVSVEEDNAEP